MVARVARTIARTHAVWTGSGAPLYEELAKEAISVMREPTERMVREGGPYATSLHCWRAMIDAALAKTSV